LEKRKVSTQTHTQRITDTGSEYDITVVMGDIDGRPEVVEVTVKSVNGKGSVSQRLLRSISIADCVRAIQSRGATSQSIGDAGEYNIAPLTEKKWTGSAEQLSLVAQMYRDAYKAHIPVQNYVASRVNRPVSSINRWIRLAREGGYLGKSNGTRGGEVLSS
jgi:hypothetical protein